MKLRILSLALILATFGCKDGNSGAVENTAETAAAPTEVHPLDKLAAAHGFDHWKNVGEIRFTFNVDRDTSHFERSWIWKPRTNHVTQIVGGDTTSFLRSEVDSTLMRADGSFINDKYWFLAPYQWVWDRESITWEIADGETAPISGETMTRLTIVYGDQGGYTPGDAYDFFIGQDSLVREWVFRRGNQPEPSMMTTWEGYEDHQGLKLATLHQNSEGPKLYFTGVEVK